MLIGGAIRTALGGDIVLCEKHFHSGTALDGPCHRDLHLGVQGSCVPRSNKYPTDESQSGIKRD
jgi:hypothetical protein